LQVLLDENLARALEELAEVLNVGKSIVFEHLHVMKDSKRRQMSFTIVN